MTVENIRDYRNNLERLCVSNRRGVKSMNSVTFAVETNPSTGAEFSR